MCKDNYHLSILLKTLYWYAVLMTEAVSNKPNSGEDSLSGARRGSSSSG